MWVITFAWITLLSTRFNVIFGAISIQEVVSGFMAVAILFKPCYFCHYFTPLINLGGRMGNKWYTAPLTIR